MSLRITGDSSRRRHYDVSEFDTIVFEEIMMYSPKLLSAIHRFIKLHPEKLINANGDSIQNLPININLNNILTEDKYLIMCINIMFPNQITLQINKRLENEEDREKLKNFKKDIFNMNLNVMDIFKKYNFKIVNKIDELSTTKNISYFRSRSYKINQHVQNNLVSIPDDYIEYTYICNGNEYTFKYYVGQRVICRQCFKRKRCQLFTNYIYEIVNIEKEDDDYSITIKNINDNKEMIIKYDQLKYMSLPYSSTSHSTQGMTIYEPYTIFDSNIAYADRRWIYTSITRCVNFNQITIFEHSQKECQALEKCKYKQYYELKVDNYINQDIIAGRITKNNDNELLYKNKVIEDYIDYKWITEQDFKCYMCGEYFDIELCDAKVNSNLTVDRIKNELPHVKNNCRLCCHLCNVSKRNL